jgi:glycosyltransferase involved in cell wall biosynthesis
MERRVICATQMPTSFAKAIERLIRGEALAKKMGVAGKKRVLSKFSFASFSDQLNKFVMDLYRR